MASDEYSRFSFQHYNKYERCHNWVFNMIKDSFKCDDLVVLLINGSPFYELASIHPLKNKIKHNCKMIQNECPTLEQYYQQFKVLKRDTKYDEKVISPTNRELTSSFYKNIDDSFITCKNAMYFKHYMNERATARIRAFKSYYWLYFNENGDIMKLTMKQAKKLYCKLYEHLVAGSHLFKILHEQFKLRDDVKIVIKSHGALEKYNYFENKKEFIDFFNNDSTDFSDCYCLAEMLINYPKLENCIWNVL